MKNVGRLEVIRTNGYGKEDKPYVNLRVVVPSGNGTRVINACSDTFELAVDKLKGILNKLKLTGTLKVVKVINDDSRFPEVVSCQHLGISKEIITSRDRFVSLYE